MIAHIQISGDCKLGFKGIVHPKNLNSVQIYSHSSGFKPMTYVLLWNIKEDILRNVSVFVFFLEVNCNQNCSQYTLVFHRRKSYWFGTK